MNTRIAFTALVLATGFAGSAFAESPLQGNDPFNGTRTRAEVQAELAAYRQAGVNPWSISYNPLRNFRSATTRAAVTAEYVAARDQVRAFNGEDSGAHYLAQHRLPGVQDGTAIAQRAR